MNEHNKPKDKRTAFVRLVGYLKPYKTSMLIGVLSNVALGLVGLVPPLLYGKTITDHVLMGHGPAAGRLKLLLAAVAALLVIQGFTSLVSFARGYVMHVLGEKIILDLRKHIYSRLQSLSVSYFDSRQTGEIMSRVTNDTEVVEEFVNHAADTLIADAFRLVAMCIVMFFLSPTLALVALIPVPLLFFMARKFSKRVRPVYRAVRERLAEISADVQERISGIRVVKAFAREDHEYSIFKRDVEAYYNQRVKAVRMWTSFFPCIDMLVQTGAFAIWIVGSIMVIHNQLSVGTMMVFIFYLGMLYQPVGNLARINDTIQRSLAAAERIFEVVDEEPAISDAENAIDMPRINGCVELDHVDFKYEDGEYVLKDICIKSEPGQIIALVGRSGAGKTSIVNLIPRFHDPAAGRVLIDGVDVRGVTQRSLRSQIGMVLQDTFLFNGTVRENIRYGRLDATDEEVIEAAKAANAHEFIEEMPNGYDTEIGERGIKLSGGQKQRLAIARAILADPRILILDEATSSVDSESEYLIHRAMDRLMDGRTTFVIAHRLSTVKHADQIITLEHGHITEVGDHHSLVDQDGVYSQMYAMQFRLNEES
ncbi:MAG: ABC transporter ATP-binding protein [Armatimonadota bacterium]|nr:ABC transporter ATP-binding protein/permease [bacterium]